MRLKPRHNLTQFCVFGPGRRCVCAQESDGEPRPWERLLLDEPRRKTERAPDLADLILIELHERLHDFACRDPDQELRHPVVMRLDERRFARAPGLDRVGIDRALTEQPFAARKIREHVVFHRQKRGANLLSLGLGIRLAADRRQKLRRRIAQPDILEAGLLVGRHHIGRLVLAHEPGIDIHAVHAILPQRIRAQFVGDGRVNAAAHEEQHLLGRPDGRANVGLDRLDRLGG